MKNKPKVEFAQKDVIKVANALVEDAIQSEHQGDYGMHEYLYVCKCCCADSPELETLVHTPNCAVLVARDLLTGS